MGQRLFRFSTLTLQISMMEQNSIEKEKIQNASILVVGDAMLDRYWFGDALRISPEAPVPVVKVKRCDERLGGAANVARNSATVGAKTSLLAVVGDDEAGEVITRLLEKDHVRPYLHKDPSATTTVKLRILAQHQQMLRTDFESDINRKSLDLHESIYSRLLPQHDLIILSDYGKGGLGRVSKIIEEGRKLGKMILVDPKGSDYSKYRYASCITPNRTELAEVIGKWRDEKDLEEKAQNLREELQLEKILLTRSEEGMTLFDQNGSWSVPAQAREVFDVSGAGDTVIAILGVMLATGCEWKTAVKLANKAGGIVVGKLGTATITFSELLGEKN